MSADTGASAFDRRAWADAFAELSAADRTTSLEPDELERLATAAYLVGKDDESVAVWERAHQALLSRGERRRAVRVRRLDRLRPHQRGPGGTRRWLDRARLAVARGRGRGMPGAGLLARALRAACARWTATGRAPRRSRARPRSWARGSGTAISVTLARNVQGRALIAQGRPVDGMRLLDEAMAAVVADEVCEMVAGAVYCSVIEACQLVFDLRRAQEWTAALSRWCESQPDLVPFSGDCLVHRAEILELHGAWLDALDAARHAAERLRHRPQPAVGAALYRQGELHRLAGRFAEAEEAYRQCQPVGARRAAGPGAAAASAAARSTPPRRRSAPRWMAPLLGRRGRACSPPPSRSCAPQAMSARPVPPPTSSLPRPRALTRRCCGRRPVRPRARSFCVEGDARAALGRLRSAWAAWQALEVPYEAARVRVLIGLACRRLGDEDTAEMELDAARWIFEDLGASHDVARTQALSATAAAKPPGPLTARELEVLRLVATGQDEPRHRRRAVPEREDRGAPRQQHLRQARPVEPSGGHRIRVRARPRVGACIGIPTSPGREVGSFARRAGPAAP